MKKKFPEIIVDAVYTRANWLVWTTVHFHLIDYCVLKNDKKKKLKKKIENIW